MADPISLTAAAAGFIGLAGQLAQGVIKVKEIYTTINDAPRDIANLCSKMAALQGVLEEVGDQIQTLCQSNVDLDTRIFRDVIAQCEKSRHRVEAHVKNISDGFRHNRGTAVRYVFKKKDIQEMLSDLEQCKTSLILARQGIDSAISACRHESLLQKHTFLMNDNRQLLQHTSQVQTNIEAVSSQQRLHFDTISQQVAKVSERSTHGYQSLRDAHNESSSKISESLRDLKSQLHSQHNDGPSNTMLARIEDIQRDIHASNRNLELLVLRRSDDNHYNSAHTTKRVKVGFQSMLFSFSVEFTSETDKQQAESKTTVTGVKKSICTIRLPNWFVQDQYNLVIARSKNGWLFSPSVYRTVSHVSPFFEACRRGDLEQIQMLLTTKQAYLGDRMTWGGSALSSALEFDQFGACKLLVDAGILSFFQSYDYTEVLASATVGMMENRNETRKVLRLIEQEQNLDSDWIDDLEIGSRIRKSVKDIRLYTEDIGVSDLNHLEAIMFLAMYKFTVHNSDLETDILRLSSFLEDENHVQEVRATASCRTWLLFAIVRKIGDLFFAKENSRPPEHAVRACRSALTVLCSIELDLHVYMEELPEEWKEAILYYCGDEFDLVHITPFAFLFDMWLLAPDALRHRYDNLRPLEEAMRLWVTTIHGAGVELESYARIEVWAINRILMEASADGKAVYTLSHGPEPDDWRLETGRPGESYPAYFWRGIEATPIGEDLAMKVLGLMHQVEHSEDVHYDVPGSWTGDWDEPYEYAWIIKGWLAFMEDSKLAQIEADLERLDAEEFYEVWNLHYVVKYWSIDEEGFKRSEGSLDK